MSRAGLEASIEKAVEGLMLDGVTSRAQSLRGLGRIVQRTAPEGHGYVPQDTLMNGSVSIYEGFQTQLEPY